VDRHLKERLVGATVLVAAAIILIPPLLDRPPGTSPEGESAATADGGMKTYTIDLNAPKARDSEAPQDQPLEIAPAPQPDREAPPPAQLPGESSAQIAVQAAPQLPPPAQAASEVVERKSPPERVAEKPVDKPADATTPKPAEKPVEKPAEKPAAQPSGGWAVQVASFGVRATSDRIANDLKAKGFSAYVMSVAVKEQTMYRVRVGPVRDRDAAEALLQKVKPLHPNAAIVTQ
jgi:DedD protein